jgi:hypothetical protein
MAALLTNATTNTDRTAATGTATGANRVLIEVPGDSVFDRSRVIIEGSSVNTAAKFGPLGRIGAFTAPMSITLDLPTGHFVRAVLEKANAGTDVSVIMTDIT